MGWHYEQAVEVLEMQSAKQLFLARLPPSIPAHWTLRVGSRLALEGVYVGSGRNLDHNFGAGSFDLLLNSPDDIVVLAQPPWWTLSDFSSSWGFCWRC